MNNTSVILAEDKFSLWEFPDKFNYSDEIEKPVLEDTPEGYKANTIIETCEVLERLLIPIAEPKNILRKLYNLFFDKTLGHSNYVTFTLTIDAD
jgi:hypothetical protein